MGEHAVGIVDDDYFVCLPYSRHDRVPVVRLQTAQIDNFYADALLLCLPGSNQRPLY